MSRLSKLTRFSSKDISFSNYIPETGLVYKGVRDATQVISENEILLTSSFSADTSSSVSASGYFSYAYAPYDDFRRKAQKRDESPVFVVNSKTKYFVADAIITEQIRINKRFTQGPFKGKEVVKTLETWISLQSERLRQNNVEPTPAKIIQLWAYESYAKETFQHIPWGRIYSLLQFNITPSIGLRSLQIENNPDYQHKQEWAYSIETLQELTELPKEFALRIMTNLQ